MLKGPEVFGLTALPLCHCMQSKKSEKIDFLFICYA